MNRVNDKSLKEAIEQMLGSYKHRRKFDETALISAWPELVGQAVASRTTQIFIRERRLFVRVNSSVVKHELLMMRSKILENMNNKVGWKVLDEIVFL